MHIKLSDFNAQVNKRGYQILFKGQTIGGAGVINCTLRGKAVSNQIKDYCKEAVREIHAIVEGNGRPYYYEMIKRINIF